MEQLDQEERPQKGEVKEVCKALELGLDTTDYLRGDTNLKQLFDSSLNKAKGARRAKKRNLSKEEQTLLWAEIKQKLKSLRRKNKK